MVDRKRQSKITRRPSQPKPEEVEALLEGLGTDPEASAQVNTQTSGQVNPDSRKQVPKDEGKAYPHRISFDMASAQYKRLKWASFDSEQSMNEIIREAVEDWMKARDY